MNKRQALTRALFGIIVFDFIKITRPTRLRATDEVILFVIGISLFLIISFGGLYITYKINDPMIMLRGFVIGSFCVYWFTYASEIIEEKYNFLNEFKQIEKTVYG